MNMNYIEPCTIFILTLSFCIPKITCVEPISFAIAGGIVGAASFGYKLTTVGYCHLKECCTPSWTRSGWMYLERNLSQHLFGQHIAKDIIVRSIISHIKNENPSKPLVLSLHGPSGTGKNHVANIIADALYYKGGKSKFVKKIIATHEFPLREHGDTYIDKFKKMIFDTIYSCPESLIIIDEVHNMPDGLLGYLSAYLDSHDCIDGVDFRKSIFILLSTVGGTNISDAMLHHWKQGLHREDLKHFDMHNLISRASYNDHDGGFSKSLLIKHNLIDFFIPFLPLERVHIKQCIIAGLKQRNLEIDNNRVDKMAGQIEYVPTNEQIFSSSGCRKIDRIIDLDNA